MGSIYEKIKKDKLFDDDVLLANQPPDGFINTGVVILNLAMSGKIDGGFPIGKISMMAADSMLGKTIIGMCGVKNAIKSGIFCVVIDGEYQWSWPLAQKMGIPNDEDKIMVIQNNSIEEVQSKVMKIVNGLQKSERKQVFFMIDSWGSLVTYESVAKSQDPESKKDMTDVLKKNKFANMLLNTNSTIYVINNIYDNVGGFGDPMKIPGGKRIILNSHTVIQGRSRSKQEITVKGDDVLVGSIVSCKVYKSRFSREHKEFKFRIKYDGGIDIYYGIIDAAIEGGFVEKTQTGYYRRTHIKDDKNFREKEIYCSDFWLPVFTETGFIKYIENEWSYQGAFDVSNDEFLSSLKPNVTTSIDLNQKENKTPNIEEKAQGK